jgi:DNA-binding transcriptional LysR family regulator
MQTGSVTRTAEALSISQPAISKLLQALELDIGIALFDRSRRRLTPTKEALRLHREIEHLFLLAGSVDRMVNQMRSSGVGELRIASLPLLGTRFMPALISSFCKTLTDLRVSLTVASSRQVAEQVIAGQADLGFAHPISSDEHVLRDPFAALAGVAILPLRHRLAKRPRLEPSDFEGERFISLGRENRLRHVVDGFFETHDVNRELLVETNYCDSACEMVAEGLGTSVVDLLSASIAGPRVAATPLSPTIDFPIEVIRPISSSASLLVERFVNLARQRLCELDATWRARISKGQRDERATPSPATNNLSHGVNA